MSVATGAAPAAAGPHPPASAPSGTRGSARPSTQQSPRPRGSTAGVDDAGRSPVRISERLYPATAFTPNGKYQEEREHMLDFRYQREEHLDTLRESLSSQRSQRQKEVQAVKSEENGFVAAFVRAAVTEESEVRRLQREERERMMQRIKSPPRSPRQRSSPSSNGAASATQQQQQQLQQQQRTRQGTISSLPQLGAERKSLAPRKSQGFALLSGDDVSPPQGSPGQQAPVPEALSSPTSGGDLGSGASSGAGGAAGPKAAPGQQSPRTPRRNLQNLGYYDRVRIRHEEQEAQRREERRRFDAERERLVEEARLEREAEMARKLNNRGYVDIIKHQSASARMDDLARKQQLVASYRRTLDEKEKERRAMREAEREAHAELSRTISEQLKQVPDKVEAVKDKKMADCDAFRETLTADIAAAAKRKAEREAAAAALLKARRDEERRDRRKNQDELARHRRENASVIDEESERYRAEVRREREEYRRAKAKLHDEVRERSHSRGSSRGGSRSPPQKPIGAVPAPPASSQSPRTK